MNSLDTILVCNKVEVFVLSRKTPLSETLELTNVYNLNADYAYESIDKVFSGWAGDSTRTYMVVTENHEGVYVSRIVELH